MREIDGIFYEYLGDGAYASYQPGEGGVMLLANHHLNPTDKVFLEFQGVDGLVDFIKRAREAAKVERSER